MNEYDHLFKILLIGNAGVGKSAMMMRFTDDTFCTSYLSTIGVDFKIRTIERTTQDGRNQIFKLQIWDTAGQERFRNITSTYYRGVHGAIIAYDVTDLESFQAIESWIQELDKYKTGNIVTMLVGNKCDRVADRVVSREEGQAKAEEHDFLFAETSAMSSINVTESFLALADGIYEKRQLDTTTYHPSKRGEVDPMVTGLRRRLDRSSGQSSNSKCCG